MLLVEALAPTNTLLGNPAALKRAFETGARSLGRGVANLVRDWRDNGGLPAQVDRRPFRVGGNLGVTPGQVVFRNEVLELIQYAPTTATVYERPLLMIPPQINKYYILDLAPGRSLIEFAVAQGFQVFVVSWRNPTPAERDWGLGTYVRALYDATSAVLDVAGSDRLSVLGACAGGITTAVLLGHLAARNDPRVASATFPVTVLDTSVESTIGMLASERTAASALSRSQRRGILEGRRDGAHLRLAATERSGVELLGQQLPPRRRPARVRHPLLEQRLHQPAGDAARRVPRDLPRRTRCVTRARSRCSTRRSTSAASRPTSTPSAR